MIKILIEKEKDIIKKITVSGHSQKDNAKIDPLCAAVSAVVLGTVNTMIELKLINQELIIEKSDGYLSFIQKKSDPIKQSLLYQMIVQLETIGQYFQKQIKTTYFQKSN